MSDLIKKVVDWVKNNVLIAILAGFAVLIFLFPKLLRKVFGTTRRRRRRKQAMRTSESRKNKPSVKRSSGRGYPAAGGGYIPFKYNKDGTIKKAQFVAGTLAAKRRMSTLRRKR